MSEELKTTQEEAENSTPETTEEKQSIEEVLGTQEEKTETPPTVGLDKFLEIKKQNKQLLKEMESLKSKIESGDDDVAGDIDSLAEAHDIDKGFLKKLVKSIQQETEKSIEERFNQKLAPLNQREKEEKINKAFEKAYNETIATMPEYDGIVNPEVIKVLTLDPKNAKKTFSQIIEETYGNAITGKRTIERTTPGGGKESGELDYSKAKSDTEYFKEVMANPKLKEKYNEKMLQDVSKYL
jgi:hypothetical protein